MYAFKDTRGRRWDVSINVAAVKKVRAHTGVDLLKLPEDGLKPLNDLLGDLCKLVDVIFVLCMEQAELQGVSDEQFGSALGGDTLDKAAECFLSALVDFFPNPSGRKMLRTALDKGKELTELMTTRMEAEIAATDAATVLRKLSGTSGSAPESLGSTPAL